MVLPAPGRFSTMIGCPICAETCSRTARAMMSVAAPGVSGTIARIGLLGQACAQAPATPKRTMAQASIKRRISTSLTVHFLRTTKPVASAISRLNVFRNAGGRGDRKPIGLEAVDVEADRLSHFLLHRLDRR